MAGPDPSQHLALQGAFYNAQQQQPVYSLEEMQLLQQSLLYAQQQGQTLVPTSREGSIVSPMALGLCPVPDAAKYKANSVYPGIPMAQQQVPIASTAAAAAVVANGTYMTMAGNGGLVPTMAYMPYMTYPGAYPQYAAPTPTLVQIPSNSQHLAAAAAMPQYPGQPKLVYGAPSVYSENISPEFKAAYTPAPSVRPVKVGGPAAIDMSGYKLPREKAFQKPGFPSGTPPPPYRPDLAPPGSSLSPPTAYPPMIYSHMTPPSQFPAPLVHPQVNQDVDGGVRRAVAAIPSKGATRGGYSRSTWRPN